MQFNVEVNKKAIERKVKVVGGVVAGVIIIDITKEVMSTVRMIKQARELRKINKQLKELEVRINQLEKRITKE